MKLAMRLQTTCCLTRLGKGLQLVLLLLLLAGERERETFALMKSQGQQVNLC